MPPFVGAIGMRQLLARFGSINLLLLRSRVVEAYPEYPDDPHPMARLKELLGELGIAGSLGADDDGYPWILGYQGPGLGEVANNFASVSPVVKWLGIFGMLVGRLEVFTLLILFLPSYWRH